MAWPTRTIVAPSSTAISKSPDMPIDSSARSMPEGASSRRRSRRSRKRRKQEVDFLVEKRVFVLLIGADRTAEHDDELGFDRIERPQRVDPGVVEMDRVADVLDRLGEGAEILEMDVADRHRGPERHPPITPPCPAS